LAIVNQKDIAMKRSRDLRAEREKFQRELDDAREERQLEVAFHSAHPQYSPDMGKVLAAEFVTAILASTERIEADYRGEKRKKCDSPIPNHAPYWEIKSYLTSEQEAVLAAAYARIERLELEQKAKSYDELTETLEMLGLCHDTLIFGDGSQQETIVVENLRVAKEWWIEASANAYEDGED
jgi:hypothetical protein